MHIDNSASSNTYYSDVWVLNVDTLVWTEIDTTETSSRAYAVLGIFDSMYLVFGGGWTDPSAIQYFLNDAENLNLSMQNINISKLIV